MTTYFTSDDHFGHRSMVSTLVGKGWRSHAFATLADMEQALIDNWNRVITPADTAWVLGDFLIGNPSNLAHYVKQLNGTKHLITGNHDLCWPGHRQAHKYQRHYLEAGFASVQAYARRQIAGQSVLLNHFPYDVDERHGEQFIDYQPQYNGKWLIHGHVHDSWKVKNLQINVGVDVWDFTPAHLDQIVEIMAGR